MGPRPAPGSDQDGADVVMTGTLDYRRLEILEAVARHGSISKAARALYLSQPALSRQIALLEDEAGTPLLHRSRDGVEPTAAGQVLIHLARRIMALKRQAEAELRLYARDVDGDDRHAAGKASR